MSELFSICTLCPRECKVDRKAGELGYCRAPAELKIARAALHYWEEPCISGKNGSGTVFFSHCTLGCVYCQNREISSGGKGKVITPERLCEIFLELQAKGAHNINLVTPTHYLPHIVWALKKAKKNGLSIPVVYNCGGYEKTQMIAELSDIIDIWLPDFKYYSADLGAKYSFAKNYPETALAAIGQMVKNTGAAVIGDDGMMQKGVMVRHLLLPQKLADSMKAIELLYDSFGDDIIFSIMSQYTPPCSVGDDFAKKYPELLKKVNFRHYQALIDYAVDLGITRCYVQEELSADSGFIPPFNGEGV